MGCESNEREAFYNQVLHMRTTEDGERLGVPARSAGDGSGFFPWILRLML